YEAEIDRLKGLGEEPLRKPAQRPSLVDAKPVEPQPTPADPATPESAPVDAEDALAEAEVNAVDARPEPSAPAERTAPPAEPVLAEEAPAKGSLNRELLRVNAAEQRKRQSPGNSRLSSRYREAAIDLLDKDFERKVAVEREATKRNLDGQNALADQAVKSNLLKDLLKIAAEKERQRKREAFQAQVPAARYGERPVAVVVPEIHQDTISTGLQTEYITQLNYPGKRTVLRKILHFYGSTEYYRNDQAIAEDDYLQALRIHQRL
ncbi:MAG: hypothetical protein AAGB22_06345, partial [Bacteroidota bacterium]